MSNILFPFEELQSQVEINSAKETNKVTWALTGSRPTSGATNRDMIVGGKDTQQVPYVVPRNCVLIGMTAANIDAVSYTSFDAVIIKNDRTIFPEPTAVATLSLVGVQSATSPVLNISFNAGDEVRIRQINVIGGTIQPRITAFFKETI